MQGCPRMPKHLYRASQLPIAGDKPFPLEQREPIAFWLVSADDVNLGANAMKALP